MIDWQDKVSRSRLVCHSSERAIAPGERFYSTLVYRDGAFARLDFCEEVWQAAGPPEDALSWWRQQREDAQPDQGPRIVNHRILLAIFHDLKDSTSRPQQCFAWLLALLLTRARKLRYLDLLHDDGEDYLLVEERGERVAHKIRDPHMSAEEETRVQDDLQQVFTMPASSEADPTAVPDQDGDPGPA